MEKLLNLVLTAEHKSYMNKIIQDWTLTKVIVLVQDNKLNSPRGRDRSIKTELEDNPEGQKTEGLHRLRGPLGCTAVYNVCVKLSTIYYFPKSGANTLFCSWDKWIQKSRSVMHRSRSTMQRSVQCMNMFTSRRPQPMGELEQARNYEKKKASPWQTG